MYPCVTCPFYFSCGLKCVSSRFPCGAPTPVEWYLRIGNVLSLDEGMRVGPLVGLVSS